MIAIDLCAAGQCAGRRPALAGMVGPLPAIRPGAGK